MKRIVLRNTSPNCNNKNGMVMTSKEEQPKVGDIYAGTSLNLKEMGDSNLYVLERISGVNNDILLISTLDGRDSVMGHKDNFITAKMALANLEKIKNYVPEKGTEDEYYHNIELEVLCKFEKYYNDYMRKEK